MTVHYCDRCKKSVGKLTHYRIPDESKCHSYDSYSVKEVELCDSCLSFINKAEVRFLSALIDAKFAFYKAMMDGGEKE